MSPSSFSEFNKRKIPLMLLIIISTFLSIWIIVGAWQVLVETFTSEITGALTKRVILFPIFFMFLVSFSFAINRVNNSTKRFKSLFIAIFILAIIIRVTWNILIPTIPQTDFEVYHKMAINLATNHQITLGKPLGYPFLLSLAYSISPSVVTGRILNIILSLITVLFVYRSGYLLSNSTGGLIAMLWMACSPSEIFMTSVLGTEIANSTVISGAILTMITLVKKRDLFSEYRFILPGIILGAAVTIRPTTILILFALIAILFVEANKIHRLRAVLWLCIGSIILPALMILWTSISVHQFTLKSLFYDSFPLLSGTNIEEKGRYNLKDAELYFSIPSNIRSQKVREIAISRLTDAEFPVLFEFISNKIRFFLTDNLYGSLWPFYTVETIFTDRQIFSIKKWIDVLAQTWYFLALIGTALLIIHRQWTHNRWWLFFVSMIAFSALPHTIFEVQNRYHHLLLPIFALASGLISMDLIYMIKLTIGFGSYTTYRNYINGKNHPGI